VDGRKVLLRLGVMLISFGCVRSQF
jgi:hypothetical protein